MRFAPKQQLLFRAFFIHFFCPFRKKAAKDFFFRYCLPAPQRLHLSSAGPSGIANCPAVFCFIVPLYFAKIERMYCNGKEIWTFKKSTKKETQEFWEREGIVYQAPMPGRGVLHHAAPPPLSAAACIGHLFSMPGGNDRPLPPDAGGNVYYPFRFDDNGLP